jgi:hypothetical protein
MSTPKTPDDVRSARQRIEEEKRNSDFIKRMEEERQHPDFIERTRPDDPSDHFGQLTRDNVNPDIPSAEPGKGDIVDPNTLGMPQAGGAPNVSKAAAPGQVEDTGSINEPPGSNVLPDAPTNPPEPTGGVPEPKVEPLPSNDELHAMKRAELDNLAEARGVDVSGASNKDEVIELLRKDARKRK